MISRTERSPLADWWWSIDRLILAAVGTLDRAVEQAAEDAAASGLSEPVVLLSPACASFDQYPNFEVRGAKFSELVRALKGVTHVPPI